MASTVGKRVAASAIDWAKAAAVCPKLDIERLRAVKSKHDAYLTKVHSLPENLPKIDFGSYKARLPDPTMADRFQKAYEALNIPYPKDTANLMQKVAAEAVEKDAELKEFKAHTQGQIDLCKEYITAMDSLPKLEDMTEEMRNYYFPETWHNKENPRLEDYNEAEQPGVPGYKYPPPYTRKFLGGYIKI